MTIYRTSSSRSGHGPRLSSRIGWILATLPLVSACMRGGEYPYDRIATTTGSRAHIELAESRLTITNSDGQPIPGARVLIGPRENVPFPGNLLRTDASGQILIPKGWNNAQPLTIDAPGFVRATYFNRGRSDVNLYTLRRLPSSQRLELNGVAKNIGPIQRDGFIDAGLVFPALRRAEVNTLQIDSLISPESDPISIAGETVNVPSNVTFPEQTETYIVFPVTFNKPAYRLYTSEARSWKIAAVHARFPFKDVVDEIRSGKKFHEVINHIEFKQVGLRDVAMTGASTTMDIPVNEIPLKSSLLVTAPNYDRSKFVMMSAALTEQTGFYYATDVKTLEPKQKLSLTAPKSNTGGLVVNVLRRTGDQTQQDDGSKEDLSVVVTPAAHSSQAVEFLPTLRTPEVRNGQILIDPPRSPSNLMPGITYAILSKVELIDNGTTKLEKKTPQWELYAEEWPSSLTLPEMPEATTPQPTGSYRWTISLGASAQGTEKMPMGPAALEKVSHVTRAAVDF